MRYVRILLLCLVFAPSSFAATYYVSLSGNNGNDGSSGRPWRTLEYAVTKVAANQGHTIQISAGTFVENRVSIPAGVNVVGAGRDVTILKANSSFYYNPGAPGFANDKCLIQIHSNGATGGNQSFKNLSIDGDGKRLHGGIFVYNRTGVVIENVAVRYVNFVGIWISQSNNATIKNIVLKDCAWGSSSWCSSALAFANSSNVDISNFDIDEGRGYGIKNLGHDTNGLLSNVKIHHGKVSVHQSGLWNGGSAPNISIELWANGFPGTAIYNTYVDNHISIVSPGGAQNGTLKIYNNVIDILAPRTNGAGYCMELSASNVDIYNNFFNGGYTGVVNWASRVFSNWNIHHNVFHAISGGANPSAVISSYKGGVTNLNAYNNTVEMTATQAAVHFLEFDNSSRGTNVNLRNNLIINNKTGNAVVNLRNGGSVSNLVANNNFFQNVAQGNAPGNYYSNTTGTGGILRSGAKPQTFYNPTAGGNLINKGVFVGFESAPDIGACGDNNVIGTAGTTTTPPPTTPTPIAVTGVSISPGSVTVAVNGSYTLTRAIAPTNATNQGVTWSSSNAGIARIDASSGVVTGVAAGTVTITVRTSDGNKAATSTVVVNNTTTPTPPPPSGTVNGQLTRALWSNLPGLTVSTMTSNSRYPNTPTSTSTVTSFQGPSNAANDYGSRIYGYIRPTTSGAYTFWIAGDDHAELWLSTTSSSGNRVLVASAPGATNPGQLNKYPQQQSAVKNLVAGQYYFIEALHKEAGGGDFVQVYWQGPGIGQSIIGSAYISTTIGGSGGGGSTEFAAQEENADEKLQVYPVPIESGADFVVELPQESREVRMLDMNGRQHLSVPVSTETQVSISSQGLRSGIYFVQVLHQRGAAVKKVMVK